MFSPEVLRHLLRRLRLVERRLPEAYRKGLHRCVRKLLHLRGDQARIHSVAQKGPQRHVADHPEPDRVLKQCVQLFRRVLIASGKRFLPAHDILYGPVTPLLNPLRRPLQDLPREQPESVSEDALPSRDVFRRQVHGQRVPVNLLPEARVLHDRLQLRREDQRIAVRIIIKRLDPHPVPDQIQALCLPVEEREGEHAVEPLHGIDAPLLIGAEDDFGIGPRPKAVPLPFQLFSQFEIVIDFSVEAHDGAATLRVHRLTAVCAQVQYRKSAVRKAEPETAAQRLQHTAPVVRSPVSDRIDHFPEKLFRALSSVYKSTDTAHDPASSFRLLHSTISVFLALSPRKKQKRSSCLIVAIHPMALKSTFVLRCYSG